MKTKSFTKLMTTMLFSICLINQIKAQEIPRDISERINNSTYIFEGQVIRSDAYWNADFTYIYTSSTIQIYKIFKGNIDCGTVEVITEGGQVADKSLSISHNLILKKGMKGIFLTKTTQHELPSTDFYPESDTNKLEIPYDLQGYIKYFEDGINYTVVDRQFNLDSLAQVYNLMQFYTQLNYIDCNMPLIMKVSEHKLKHQEKADEVKKDKLNDKLISATLNPNKNPNPLLLTGTLTYTLMNPHIVNSYPRKFEFDVALGDNVSNYFDVAYVVIDYDTNTFGANIVTHHHTEITNNGFASDTNSYTPIIPFDQTYNELIFSVAGINSQNSFLANISNSPNPAAHVILTIKDCDVSSNISLQDPNIFAPGSQEWTDSIHGNSQSYNPYTSISLSSPLTVPSCGLAIDTMTPTQVNGGVGDTVTLRGFKFGATRGKGNVFLPDANDGANTYISLDSIDYVTWTDSLIKFIVPGITDSSYNYTTQNRTGVPGSGSVKVKNDAGDSTKYSKETLLVFYSIINKTVNDGGTLIKKLPNLIDYNSVPQGGYIFRVDTSFSHHPDRMSCLRAAIHDWQCLSNVPFILGDTIQSSAPHAMNDSLNIIQFSTDTTPTSKIAYCSSWKAFGPSCHKELTLWIDLTVNKIFTNQLFCDTINCDSVPTGQIDLYHILLHELGHAHNLNHINDPSRIMWWAAPPTPTQSGYRGIYLLYDLSSKLGANYVMQQATNSILPTCGSLVHLITPVSPTGCDTTIIAHRNSSTGCVPFNAINENGTKDIELICYPNPTNRKLSIEFKLEYASSITIKIFDSFGKEIENINKNKLGWGKQIIEINSTNFASGIYFLQLINNEKIYSSKFIKN